MAATGYTPIRLYYSTTGSAVPTAANLAPGELGLNIADMKLYCENSSGVVTLLASAAGASGDVVGPASSTANSVPTFSGTTGKLIQNNSGVTISAGVVTATGFSGPHNGTVGATTPSTGVFTQVDITAQGDLRLQDTTGGQYVALQAPGTVSVSYTLTLPTTDGDAGQFLQTDGSGVLTWAAATGSTPLSIATTTAVNASATTTIDCSLGSVFDITWDTNITTLTISNVPASPQATELRLVFKKDSTANPYSIAWPSSIYWNNNSAPTTTAVTPYTVITVSLLTVDGGTKWRGSFQTIEGNGGALWAIGDATYNQLGIASTTSRSSPIQVGSLTNWVSSSSFNSGDKGSLALTNDGVINGAGTQDNAIFGTLGGNPFVLSRMVPVASGLRAFAISSGYDNALAIDLDGKLWGWGGNNGCLGAQSNLAVSTPIIVAPGSWIDVCASRKNGFAIRSDGTFWRTGDSGSGFNGGGVSTSVWTQLGTDTNWYSVCARGNLEDGNVLALKTNGTLWAWGYNLEGSVGDGTAVTKSSPVQIGSGTDWYQVSTNNLSCAAIKSDGTLWTWGYGAEGVLGLGGTTSRSSPTQVGAGTDWKQVCVGQSSMWAIKTNGTLWAWGRNNEGQLGLNDTSARSSPVQVGAATDWLWLPKNAVYYHIHIGRGTPTNP